MSRNSSRRHNNDVDHERLSFIPLGGLGEIGKNMYVLEYGDEIIVIDSGLKFPDSELPGIDYIVPDISYLEQNRDKILAIIITHGHEDHVGGLPYVLPRLDVPLYGTQLTLGLIRNKLMDDIPMYHPDYHEIRAGDVIKIGSFTVRFIAVAHSIPDCVALSIETPLGRIVHTGDFKLDSTPVDGRVTDYGAFAEEGDKGVMLLCSDSTNAERKGFTPSERIISGTLDTLFRTYRTKRIIISSFASNVHRIQQVADVSARFNRKIAFLGRSMLRNVELARDTGYLKIDGKMIIQVEEIWKYSNNNLVVVTTGSQGEPFSGLVTMSRGENRAIELGEHDVVFLLASVIPGNEKLINNTINRLFALGCEVVYEKDRQIHVSGHASSEELKIMLNLTRPQYFLPVHGEYKHLVRHSQLAQEVGISPRNIFLMVNGDVLTFTRNAPPKKHGHVRAGAVIVDGQAAGSIKSEVLKERREISEDGVIAVAVAVDDKGNLLAPPAIETQGVFISEDSRDIFKELYAVAEQAVQELAGRRANPDAIRNTLGTRVRDVLRKRNSSFAVVMPIVSVKPRDDSNIYEKEFF
ncbi:MAG: ribonuclease J [Synergistaceae bacterium]|nr:ribonuclease J [Synergistaceae bacterium]MBQ3346388.1 ribonuclease J [Synergistaceae bacterium]MBQ3397475.1 ribonuclease J [Synergistaceae bacterium]MBQ6418704.1 ribonuclease J [Synergistaceae bacterium]